MGGGSCPRMNFLFFLFFLPNCNLVCFQEEFECVFLSQIRGAPNSALGWSIRQRADCGPTGHGWCRGGALPAGTHQGTNCPFKTLTRNFWFCTLALCLCVCLCQVFLKERLYQQLEEKWSSTQTWAAITIQRNIRGFLCRRNFKFFKQKAIIIQSHIRGHQTRYRQQGKKGEEVKCAACRRQQSHWPISQ